VRPEARPGTETILVVENEDPVRELILDVLRLHGYTVLAAADGTAAFEVAANYPGRIDLAIVDVVMPGMTGQVVARRLAAERPGLRILYVSGYTSEEVRGLGLPPGSANFLQKPFTIEALTDKVRDVLAAPPGGAVSG
jgi:DNA-binding response OmpR family regulator